MTARPSANETPLPVGTHGDGVCEYAWDGYYRVIYFGASGRVHVGTAGDKNEAIRVAESHRTRMAAAILKGGR